MPLNWGECGRSRSLQANEGAAQLGATVGLRQRALRDFHVSWWPVVRLGKGGKQSHRMSPWDASYTIVTCALPVMGTLMRGAALTPRDGDVQASPAPHSESAFDRGGSLLSRHLCVDAGQGNSSVSMVSI